MKSFTIDNSRALHTKCSWIILWFVDLFLGLLCMWLFDELVNTLSHRLESLSFSLLKCYFSINKSESKLNGIYVNIDHTKHKRTDNTSHIHQRLQRWEDSLHLLMISIKYEKMLIESTRQSSVNSHRQKLNSLTLTLRFNSSRLIIRYAKKTLRQRWQEGSEKAYQQLQTSNANTISSSQGHYRYHLYSR